MTNADQYVKKAQLAIDRKDLDAARKYLKRAAALAPLRTDIRQMLAETLGRTEAAPTAGKKRVAGGADAPLRLGREKQGGRGPLLLVLGFVSAAFLAAAGFLIVQNTDLASLVSGPAPPPEATPDPDEIRRAELLDRAESFAEQMKYSEAIEALKQLLGTDPPDPKPFTEALNGYRLEQGKIFFVQHRFVLAIEHFQKAAANNREDAEILSWLGKALFRKGKREKGLEARNSFSEGRRALLKSVRLDPEDLTSYKMLAQICIALGKPVEGRNYYDQIIKRAPGSREAGHAASMIKAMGMK